MHGRNSKADHLKHIKHRSDDNNAFSHNNLSVLVVGTKWPPETFIQRRLQGLSQRGVNVMIANPLPAKAELAPLPGVTLIRLPHWKDPLLLSLLRSFYWATRLTAYNANRLRAVLRAIQAKPTSLSRAVFARLRSYLPLASLNPDIVHFEWISAAGMYASFFTSLNIPIVVSCRGSQVNIEPQNPEKSATSTILRAVFQDAAAVHCVSEAIGREAASYGLEMEKAWIIRPAVDPNNFFPPSARERTNNVFDIVTTGSLVWRKGYEYALVAIRKLLDQNIPVHFNVIGEGIEQNRLLYTIQDLGLEHTVSLLGRQTPEQIRDRLHQADVFFLPSLSEGISNAVLEAMACGLPVVTTEGGGMREAVCDGVEGFVVPVGAVEDMADALGQLARNIPLRKQMGKAARERVLAQFTLDHQITQFINLYQSVLDKRPSHAHSSRC